MMPLAYNVFGGHWRTVPVPGIPGVEKVSLVLTSFFEAPDPGPGGFSLHRTEGGSIPQLGVRCFWVPSRCVKLRARTAGAWSSSTVGLLSLCFSPKAKSWEEAELLGKRKEGDRDRGLPT